MYASSLAYVSNVKRYLKRTCAMVIVQSSTSRSVLTTTPIRCWRRGGVEVNVMDVPRA